MQSSYVASPLGKAGVGLERVVEEYADLAESLGGNKLMFSGVVPRFFHAETIWVTFTDKNAGIAKVDKS